MRGNVDKIWKLLERDSWHGFVLSLRQMHLWLLRDLSHFNCPIQVTHTARTPAPGQVLRDTAPRLGTQISGRCELHSGATGASRCGVTAHGVLWSRNI